MAAAEARRVAADAARRSAMAGLLGGKQPRRLLERGGAAACGLAREVVDLTRFHFHFTCVSRPSLETQSSVSNNFHQFQILKKTNLDDIFCTSNLRV